MLKNKLPWIVLILILLVFIYLRVYRIEQTLNFQNDIGRDYLVLLEWLKSGKPPLLGPQNSAVPFNQSAVYFYLFFPFFVVSGMSFLTTFWTNLSIHLLVFVGGLSYLCRKNKIYSLWPILATMWLVAIHPQWVIQHRYVWNPSLVLISIMVAFVSFIELRSKFSRSLVWLFASSLSFSVAMNLSAVPVLILFLLAGMICFGRKGISLLMTTFVSGNIWFLPYWMFELRYDFQIIKRVLGRQILTLNPSALAWPVKWSAFERYLLGLENGNGWILTFLLVVLCGAYGWRIFFYYKKNSLKQLSSGLLALSLLLLTLVISMLMPVPIESHYIFPVLGLLVFTIGYFPNRWLKIGLIIALSCQWLRIVQLEHYFQPAPRTITQLDDCFRMVCQKETEPIFVSVQSQYPYHSGPEFRYLMLKNGCQMKHIETNPLDASLMAVVADQAEYHHGQTSYDELSLFGPAQEKRVYSCTANLQVHIIERLKE